MKFYDLRKTLGRGTRLWAKLGGFTSKDATDADQLARTITTLMQRVSDLEGKSSPEAVEFEYECPEGGTFRLAHGFQGPVRWYVTHWFGSEYGPQLSTVHTTEAGTLTLSSLTKGYAVIRVEASQYGVSRLQDGYQSVFGPAMGVNGFRISGSSTDPTGLNVTTSTIYLSPYTHGGISIYNGTGWVVRRSGQVSLALSGMVTNSNYDIFASWNGSAVTLTRGAAWTNNLTRSAALGTQDGVLVSGTDPKQLYVGTIRATGATTTVSSNLQRFIWSRHNQIDLPLVVQESLVSWAGPGTANTWRQSRALSTNRVEYVSGSSVALEVHAHSVGSHPGPAGGIWFASGVGIDSTTVNSAQVFGGLVSLAGSACPVHSKYRGNPALGYHAVNWLEASSATGTTFFGASSPIPFTTGMVGSIRG
jgi:hypothetical protein